jgi:hypothetical protein
METTEAKLATGRLIKMKEANAEDEGILTRIGYKSDNTSIARYLSSLIVEVNGEAKKLSYSEIMEWPLADKYLALIHSRIFNCGNELEFKYKFPDEAEFTFTQHLDEFLDPLKKGCKPYPFQEEAKFDLQTKTGKFIKYKLLNSYGEKLIAQKERDNVSTLDILKSRFLEWDPQGNTAFITVENFRDFTVRESIEIRQHIADHESNLDLYMELKHPTDPKYNTYINLLDIPDFLAPLGI